MLKFDFQGGEIAFSDTEIGEPLLLIPGLGGQFGFWSAVAESLRQDFRVISFDHPGSGNSFPLEQPVTVEILAELAFSLLDHLNIKTCRVIGQSLGGAVAQKMALSHPERITRLVLSSTWASPDAGFLKSFRLRRQILEEMGLAAYAKAQVLSVLNPEQIAADPAAAEDWERKTVATSNRQALLERMDALMAFDCSDEIADIKQPVMVVGAEDDLVVPKHMSRQLADLIPGAVCRFLPAGGHFLPLTRPGDYVNQVLSFLRGESVSRRPVSVLMIGCGAIGQFLLSAANNYPDVTIAAVLVPPNRVENYASQFGQRLKIACRLEDLAHLRFDFAIECAGHEGLQMFGADVLRKGIRLGVLSAGALSDADILKGLEDAALAGGAQLEILSGAIAGLDALRALQEADLQEVHLTSRKPPSAWRGSAAERTVDLDACEAAVELFSGPAREAAQLYPKNANVAAAIALAGLGFDRTEITLIADPDVTENGHELRVVGNFGTFTTRLESPSLPDNPRTSAMAALSALAAIRQRRAGLV
ncbi:aspartate dehydrogenase [Roseibium sp. SCP14]|uniref:aspartate dehydrogenase n=1 Tax=Roseibium sp. SCP14 TaxID=3141375 RepID=UPI00333BC22D